MRTCLGIVLLASVPWHAGADTQTSERLARLIKQLGHTNFAQRETAAKELEKIGAPALPALRQAQTTADDAEIRARARQVVEAINRTLRATAAKDMLAKWQGEWFGNGDQTLLFKDSRWRWDGPGARKIDDTDKNRIEIVEVGDKLVKAELILSEAPGWNGGRRICRAIFRLDGDTLHYCGTYEANYPTAFQTTAHAFYVAWWRVKPAAPPPDKEPHRFPPCHPGCFPAGTLVEIPGGTKAIERIKEGERVFTVDAAGKPAVVKVTGVFKTRNRVLTLRTADGQLITTETQPIALEKGGFAPARELKQGDRIWRWIDGRRRATRVLGVSPADRETEVFNLILGEQSVFIAGGFVVRSKPPAALTSVPVMPVP